MSRYTIDGMRHAFYDSEAYRHKQSQRTTRNQRNGVYEHLKKEVIRACERNGCKKAFSVNAADPKRYCSNGCAATVNNSKRRWSIDVKQKISNAHKGKKSPLKGTILVPRLSASCLNLLCRQTFTYEQYRSRKYCSRACAFGTVNSQPTSAKASRGKSGIRPDVDPLINFHSRWEANVARL